MSRSAWVVVVVVLIGAGVLVAVMALKSPPSPPSASIDPALVGSDGAKTVATRFLDSAKDDPLDTTAVSFAAEEFLARWRSPAAEPVRYFRYSSWQAGEPTFDAAEETATFRGEVQVTAAVERENTSPTTATLRERPTGGTAAFTLTLRTMENEAWRVTDFRFDPRPPRAGMSEPTAYDIRDALGGVLGHPTAVLGGRTEMQLAEELSASVWPIWYSGGPVKIGVTVVEVGQSTATGENLFGNDPARTSSAVDGRVSLSLRRWTSDRMRQAFEKAGKSVSAEGVMIGIHGESTVRKSVPLPFLWFHWPGVKFDAKRLTSELRAGQAVPVLVIEATENAPANGAEPRRVTVTVTVTKLRER